MEERPMAVTEEIIATVLKLVPECTDGDTVDCLMQKPELKQLSKHDIYGALHTLEARGKVQAGDLIPRGIPFTEDPDRDADTVAEEGTED
jgi:hypothetical protein